MAIQLARHAGAGPPFTTAGSEPSARYLMGILSVAREQLLFYAGLSREQLEQRLRQQNGGHLFRVAIDCVDGAMTGLCCDIVDFEGHVLSIVQGPRDASHPTPVLCVHQLTMHVALTPYCLKHLPDGGDNHLRLLALNKVPARLHQDLLGVRRLPH